MTKWLNIILGGIAGTVARYLLSGVVYKAFGARFPYGTIVVNLTGCFIIGFLDVLSTDKFMLDTNARLLLMVGFCGAFTTFSTFMLETSNLMKDGQNLLAFANVTVSVVAGFICFKLGMVSAKIL